MSVTYNKTNWVNEVTPLDADNMNNIENGIESLVNAVNEGGGGSTITIDDSLSNTSTNPVQNKVITLALDTKVNKETGKVLSTNDFTDADKTKLDSLENYNDSEIRTSLANKVDKVAGKGLSTNDYTATDKAIVEYSKTLEDGFIKPLNKDNSGLIFHNPDAITDNVMAVDDTISASSVGVPRSSAVKAYIESYINSLNANEVAY